MMTPTRPVGDLIREWRMRRRLSQLDLALEAEISAKHLSFLETGRSTPSREMVLLLAAQLDVPLRERNVLLVAAGYAPVYPERPLADPAMESVRKAVELVLAGHEPYPALAVNRYWELITANRAVTPLMTGVDPALLQPPINVLRFSLHPQGLAPRIANYAEWRAHLLVRLRQQIDVSGDPVLIELLKELRELPPPPGTSQHPLPEADTVGVAVPFELRTEGGVLSFYSTTTVFGTPVDVTLSELALETFFPANAGTAEALRRLAGGNG
jgi:transcriptional regulator with XRE-family HTH domain